MRTKKEAIKILDELEFSFPPEDLRGWVGGSRKEEFEAVGKAVSLNLFDIVEPLGILDSEKSSVLDFGCGCGRTIRYLKPLYPKCNFYGVDPDAEGIDWCKENLSGTATFVKSETRPQLNLDEKFDLVYAISVFTHLPEQLQLDWLAELKRVTKSGGYLILSTLGENTKNPGTEVPLENRKEFIQKGFWYRDANRNKIGSDYLDTVWHTREYIQKNWGKYFQIVNHIDRGINSHQDLILCRNI